MVVVSGGRALKSQRVGLIEIKNDLDEVAMALAVDDSRVTNVYVKVARVDIGSGLVADKVHEVEEDVVMLEGTLIGESIKGKEVDEGSELNDFEYSFGEEDGVVVNDNLLPRLIRSNDNEGLRTVEDVSSDLLSQVVDIPGQALPGSSTANMASLRREKLATTGGKKQLTKSQARKHFPARAFVLRHQVLQKEAQDKSKMGGAAKKRRVWLPPGPGVGGGGPAPAGKPS
ncbi:hypothetical protein J5N97_028625 [Dioscorea zingiberensis]|uniref:Uncharacterized protein n=1 Tax=Dioscorea zingiberensis TaxID=325984 RepID=A0A9D5BZV5_9LILI|nr:hypothetical protein J5N97_028625 [Dioscorea zingiberensis]